LRIGIDGYNLAMPAGTGVATYGAALARTLATGGHRVEGVFGLAVGDAPDMREVNFFDLLGRDDSKQKTQRQQRRERRGQLYRALDPRLRLAGVEVPLTELVEKGAFADRFPTFDRLTSCPDLFAIAHRHFELYGHFTTLRIPDPPEVMHWTYPLPVTLAGARNIYTLHDLVPLRLPYTTLDVKHTYVAIVAACVRDAAHICTVSEASRRDILDRFPTDPARVSNCYQASPMPPAALAGSAEADAHVVEGVFGLPPAGYFLFFGAIEPKKNVGRLLEAYLALQTPTPLVIVGARAWQSESELRLLAQAGGRAGRIVQLDYLPRALLLKLIRSARAVVFPSLYEGFGLPVLEAMQLGTPVLTSRTSSLPEVAGDAAVFVDPYDATSIAQALASLDNDAGLRDRLRAAGLAQAALFSPERYRARLDAMYARVLGRA
jgi:glycosyltransferase involved in cell wall biosynthesis